MYLVVMVEIFDLALKAVIDSFEIDIFNWKKIPKLTLSYSKLYLG